MATVFHLERTEGSVATIWLDRPDARNAMGRAFFAELPGVVAEVSGDPEVRAIVLAARGPHFCAGLDLKEMAWLLATQTAGGTSGRSRAARAAALRRSIVELQSAIGAVAACPKPVVAAVHGSCIGGGMDLVTACDIRLASEDAVFSVRETKMAIVADLGTLQRLPRIVGGGHATELALTGRDITARRAKEIGLVTDVLGERDALVAAARQLAHEIASLAPLAVEGTKAVLGANDGRTVAQGLEFVATWNAAMAGSDDVAEAVRAFVERRAPRFGGS